MRFLLDAPRGIFRPAAQGLCGPSRGFVGVALGTGVWNFVFFGHCGSDDREGMGTDENVRDGRLDFGHVARDALTTRRIGVVMGMFFERGAVGTVERHWSVAIEAQLTNRFA